MTEPKQAEKPGGGGLAGWLVVGLALSLGLGTNMCGSKALRPAARTAAKAEPATTTTVANPPPLSRLAAAGGEPETVQGLSFAGYRLQLPEGWKAVPTESPRQFIASPEKTERITASLTIERIPVRTSSEAWEVVRAWEQGHRIVQQGGIITSGDLQSRWVDLVAPPTRVEALTPFLNGAQEVPPFPQRRLYVVRPGSRETLVVTYLTTEPGSAPGPGAMSLNGLLAFARSIRDTQPY